MYPFRPHSDANPSSHAQHGDLSGDLSGNPSHDPDSHHAANTDEHSRSPSPRLRNVERRPAFYGMDIDSEDDDNTSPERASADTRNDIGINASNPEERKRQRFDGADSEPLEHDEPVAKRRRLEVAEPEQEQARLPMSALPCNLREDFLKAAIRGEFNMIERFIAQNFTAELTDGEASHVLIVAAIHGDLKIMEWSVAHCATFTPDDCVDGCLNTPLHFAAASGHIHVIEWLVARGVDINQTNSSGETPAYVAAGNGCLAVLRWMSEHGSDLNISDSDDDLPLSNAALNGHLETMKWLVSQGQNVDSANDHGITAIMHAAANGHLDCVQWLASQGALIDRQDNTGKTALIYAVRGAHLDTARWLVSQGCKIDDRDKVDRTLLSYAAEGGSVEILEWLTTEGCDPNIRDSHGRNALFYVVKNNCLNAAKFLIDKGVDVSYQDATGSGPLLLSVENECPEMVGCLAPLSDISLRDGKNQTVIMRSASEDSVLLAPILIEHVMKRSDGVWLCAEALPLAQSVLFRDLLSNPSIVCGGPLDQDKLTALSTSVGQPLLMLRFTKLPVASWLSSSQFAITSSAPVACQLLKLNTTLPPIERWLASKEIPINIAQREAAIAGYCASLPVQQPTDAERSVVYYGDVDTDFPSDLLNRLLDYTAKEIERKAESGTGWEAEHLVPTIQNLFDICVRHSLKANPAADITKTLTASGFYTPIAQRMSAAWLTAWTLHAATATPLLQPQAPRPTTIEEWEMEDLGDLDPLSGETSASKIIDQRLPDFMDAPVAGQLLAFFSQALREQFDAVDGASLLRIDDPEVPEESQALFSELMFRQIHLVAQFWRAE